MAFIVGLPLVLIGILLLFRRKLLPRWLCLLLSLVLLALSVLVALGSRVVLVHFGVGRSPILLSFRMLMPAYVWPICWIGALCAFSGIVVLSVVLAGLGGVSSLIAARYINQVTKSHDAEFASAFGRIGNNALRHVPQRCCNITGHRCAIAILLRAKSVT